MSGVPGNCKRAPLTWLLQFRRALYGQQKFAMPPISSCSSTVRHRLANRSQTPTYWGWWRLGRQVSMSPLEIARAFNAPILQDADPNATGDDLKRELGHKSVCFALKDNQLMSGDSR